MAKQINFKDLIDVPSFEQFLTVLDTMKKSMSDIISLSSKTVAGGVPTNAKELKEYIASVKASEQAQISLEKIEQERIKTQTLLDKATQAKIKTDRDNLKLTNDLEKGVKKELDAYQQLSKQYNDAAKSAKALAVIWGENSKQAKDAAAKALALDEQLKRIDATVGQHQRNVGNYSKSMQDAIRQSGLFSSVLAISDKITEAYNGVLEIANTLLGRKAEKAAAAAAAETVNTTSTEANTVAEELNTVAKETNIIKTEEEIAAEKLSKAAKEADIVATEADTVAQKANTLAKLGLVGVIIAGAALLYEAAKMVAQGWWENVAAGEEYVKILKETGTLSAASAAKARKYEEINLEKEHLKAMVETAKYAREAAQARDEANKTDVIPEKIKKLKEFVVDENMSYDLEIEHSSKKVAMYQKEYDALISAGKEGSKHTFEVKKQLAEAQVEYENAAESKADATRRINRQILSEEAEIKKEELKMQEDSSKRTIELIKEDEKKKTSLENNSYQNEFAALTEQHRKLGDADTQYGNATASLWKLHKRKLEEITIEANEKEIAEMQKLQDTLLSIQLKTHTLDNELIHEEQQKKLNASKDTHEKELLDIKKQNDEIEKAKTELSKGKLNGPRTKEQLDLLGKQQDALNAQKTASDLAYADRSVEIVKETSNKIIDIQTQTAVDDLKQQEKLLNDKLNLAEKQTGRDSNAGIKKQLADIQIEKDIAHQIELKKDEEFEAEYNAAMDKINNNDKLTQSEKKAAFEQEQHKYDNELINAHQDYLDSISELDKKAADEEAADEAKRREAALQAIEDFEKASSEKQQRKFDNEIDASKRHQDLLKDMAARGNQDAKNNLAMEEANEAKLQLKKEKAIAHQKQVEAGLAILKTYSAALGKEGATPEKAIKDTLKAEVLLAALIKSLPAFFEGTEDTGEAGNVDSKGGKIAVLHPHERVLTAEQNKAVDGLSNWQLANAGLLYKKEIENKESERFMSNEKILQKFDSLEKAIKEKPVYMGNEYQKDSHQLIEMIEQGNSLVINHKTLSKLG